MQREILEKELEAQDAILDNAIEELAENCNDIMGDFISETIDDHDVELTCNFEDIYQARNNLEDTISNLIESLEEKNYSEDAIKELRDNMEKLSDEISNLDDSFWEYKDSLKDDLSINKKMFKELFSCDADSVINPILEIKDTYKTIDELEIALKHCIFNE